MELVIKIQNNAEYSKLLSYLKKLSYVQTVKLVDGEKCVTIIPDQEIATCVSYTSNENIGNFLLNEPGGIF